MLSHWMIKALNMAFVVMLLMYMLWLTYKSMRQNIFENTMPRKRSDLIIEVTREGNPYKRIILTDNHCIIGRAPECKINLKGQGIPLRLGEIRYIDGHWEFHNKVSDQKIRLMSGSVIFLYNYTITFKEIGG